MKQFLRGAIVLALLAIASAAYNCNADKCAQRGLKNTLCLYTNPNPASACGKVQSATITESEKQEIVNKHNELRALVASGQEKRGEPGPQPAAVSMPNLVWDNDLAEVAQRWANQCQFGHDKCRTLDKFSVGQNVGMTSTTGAGNFKPSGIIMSWYNEVAKFDRNQVSHFTKYQEVGHYSQMVWATTTHIGCGKVAYNKDGWNTYYLVCDYGPAGNLIGGEVYKIKP